MSPRDAESTLIQRTKRWRPLSGLGLALMAVSTVSGTIFTGYDTPGSHSASFTTNVFGHCRAPEERQ